MKLRNIVWSSVMAVQVMTGCGRHDDARHTVTDDAAGRQLAQAQRHEHAAAHTSNGVEAPVGDARRLSRMERVARTLEDFSASLGLQAKSFTLHPELQLAACSNVFDLLPDEEFKLMIYDFHAARGDTVSAEELCIMRDILDARIRKNIAGTTPGEYEYLLSMKMGTYYCDTAEQDYEGFERDTQAALALVRTVHADSPQLTDFVVATLVAAGENYPTLQYLAAKHGGHVRDDFVGLLDDARASLPLTSRQMERLAVIKYHCLAITQPERVIEEGHRFLATAQHGRHFSLQILVDGLQQGLRGMALDEYRLQRFREAFKK